jgi:hypothetical protein
MLQILILRRTIVKGGNTIILALPPGKQMKLIRMPSRDQYYDQKDLFWALRGHAQGSATCGDPTRNLPASQPDMGRTHDHGLKLALFTANCP